MNLVAQEWAVRAVGAALVVGVLLHTFGVRPAAWLRDALARRLLRSGKVSWAMRLRRGGAPFKPDES